MIKQISAIALVVLTFFSYLYLEKKFDYFRFNESKKISEENKNFLEFKESANELGITHSHETLDISEHLEGYSRMKNYKNFLPTNATAAAVDFDNDGYTDLFFTNGTSKRSYFLYRNNRRGSFEDVTDKVGLLFPNDRVRMTNVATFFDFDNDGYKDLFIGHGRYNRFFHNVKGKKFVEMTEETNANAANGVVTGVKVFDYNKDGWPDLYATLIFKINYGDDKNGVSFFSPRITKNNRSFSSGNFLLKNIEGKKFELVPEAGGAGNNQLTWDAGIMDYNNDGWPDILVANDFSVIRLYENNQKGQFIEKTDQALGKQFTSSNMGIVFSDINHDGLQDFYVSNISRSSYTSLLYNQLFIQNPDHTFTDRYNDYGMDKCGWSWGSQFADFDLDGDDELVVANGMFDDGNIDYYYKWLVYVTLPSFMINGPNILPNTKGHRLASHERNCFFKKNGSSSQFEDIALSIGVTDIKNGRGLSLIDINNDGRLSFVIANYSAEPVFYKNISKKQKNWFGLKLIGTKSGKDAYGALIRVTTKSEKQIHKLYNPTQGFSAQNDPRVLIGLGDDSEFDIRITWPSGQIQNLSNIQSNTYTEIVEPM